jgi:hypothetical protein
MPQIGQGRLSSSYPQVVTKRVLSQIFKLKSLISFIIWFVIYFWPILKRAKKRNFIPLVFFIAHKNTINNFSRVSLLIFAPAARIVFSYGRILTLATSLGHESAAKNENVKEKAKVGSLALQFFNSPKQSSIFKRDPEVKLLEVIPARNKNKTH